MQTVFGIRGAKISEIIFPFEKWASPVIQSYGKETSWWGEGQTSTDLAEISCGDSVIHKDQFG